MPVTFEESCIDHIDLMDLPADWANPDMAPSVQATGDSWVRLASSLILQVPSAIVPGEYNYLLNPAHEDMASLIIGDLTDFNYDDRLIK